jgi:hypothetical protein
VLEGKTEDANGDARKGKGEGEGEGEGEGRGFFSVVSV